MCGLHLLNLLLINTVYPFDCFSHFKALAQLNYVSLHFVNVCFPMK